VTPRTLAWRADSPFWLDVAAFEELADGDPEALAGAVALYRGDLLEGLDDEWLAEGRERLRRRCLQALERLVALLAERGDHAGAIPYAERLLRQDPLQEAAWRTLMGLHDARGDRARALHAYHACAATLERELGVEPSPPIRRAYEALLGGRESPDSAGPAAARAGPLGGPPLVGRAAQQAGLQALWRAAERGQARLVVVTGEAGIGKTRLVEELRTWCARRGVAPADARSYPAEGALA
jgi:DNA-binding SARP family transcriptional activator